MFVVAMFCAVILYRMYGARAKLQCLLSDPVPAILAERRIIGGSNDNTFLCVRYRCP